MTTMLLAVLLTLKPVCVGDGHNKHRNKSVIKKFVAAHPCPDKCAVFRKTSAGFVLWRKCGGCQVDHICPLACWNPVVRACGPDTINNLQWLTAEENSMKSDDCSACPKQAGLRN